MLFDPEIDRDVPIAARRHGRCEACRDSIWPGELIQKRDGRWSHSACIVKRKEIAATVASENAAHV